MMAHMTAHMTADMMDDLRSFTTYRIGEAAALLGVKTSVLRFWETEFPQINPIRKESGQRLYSEESMGVLRRIRHLLYEEKLTIEGARMRLEGAGQPATEPATETLAPPASAAPPPATGTTASHQSSARLLSDLRAELLELRALLS